MPEPAGIPEKNNLLLYQKQNNRTTSHKHGNTHPRTTRHTHRLAKTSTYRVLQQYSKRTAANRCVDSYSNFARAGRYSGGTKWCTKEKNTATSHRRESTHPRMNRPPPIHPSTHPLINASTYHPTTICCRGAAVRTAANRYVWSVVDVLSRH